MVNKFDKGVAKDWSWKTARLQVPTLDYDMLNSIAATKQAEFDNIASLNAMVPNALQNADDLAKQQEYRTLVNNGTQAVTDAYMKSVSTGAMAYRDFKNQVQKAWQPGGVADMLNKRYSAYFAADKAIDDFYKDDTSPVNKALAKKQLRDQASRDTGYDPSTGKYNQIATPELYKNPKINERIDAMLKEIMANGDTQFLGDLNKSSWIQKIKTETREPERIKLAFQALSQQPEYASQIQRDADYRSMTIDPTKHQALFEANQKASLDQLTTQASKAKNDKQSTKDWQNLLRQQGYNVEADGDFGALTEKATKDLLEKQKNSVNSNISEYDFKNQMRNEVSNSYLGYALRGAYKKTDKDLVLNKAKFEMMDYAVKKEANNIAMWAAQMEFAPKPQANTTAVSGLAQQLPEIQTYHKDIKDQLANTEKQIDQALSKSTTFKGWTKENVAEAYNTWNKVQGSTPEEKKANYKALLGQKSNYPFTDDQVDVLYNEMNGVGDGMIKTTLKTLGDLQSEVSRIEEGQSEIASQYIQTEEGKKNLLKLEPFRQRGETDEQLASRAIRDPESFESKVVVGGNSASELGKSFNPANWFGDNKKNPWNVANQFIDQQNSDIKKNPSGTNYNWGSLGTFEIYANNGDETLKPTFDGISQALETGTGKNFIAFGKAGVTYKNLDGDEIPAGKSRKVNNITTAIGPGGVPMLRAGMTITDNSGKTKDAYTDIHVVPGSVESVQLMEGAKKAYVEKLQAEGPIAAQPYLDYVEALQGKKRESVAAADITLNKLDLNNTKSEPIFIQSGYDSKGNPVLTDIRTMGWQVTNLEMDENIGGYGYGLLGINSSTGNGAANVMTDSQGRQILVPAVGQPDKFVYNSTDAAMKDRVAKGILSTTPVEVTERRVNRSGTSSSKTEITKTSKSE